MSVRPILLPLEFPIDLGLTVTSHGWAHLAPWRWDDATGILARRERIDGTVGTLAIRQRDMAAILIDSESFGPMVAAEAQERNFFAAQRKAFVADGAAYNWTIQRGYFADFEPIADFLHVLCYLYLAARVAGVST